MDARTGATEPGTDPAAPARPRRVVHEVAHDLVRAEDLRGLRSALVGWVRTTAGCPEGPAFDDLLEDVATALYEALTNVVDHAYPAGSGPVRVAARLTVTGADGAPEDSAEPATPENPWLEVEVADRGGWRPAPADPGHRGRGLQLLAGLADGHELHRDAEGTRVLLWWHRPP